jgi:hypothetical protein
MTDAEWAQAVERLTDLLVATAARRSTVTYGEAARVAFRGRFSARSGALMDLLGDVDEGFSASHGIMIATLVVRADSGRPGDGYFHFAHDVLGADVSDREAFWSSEAARVWSAFAAAAAR